jgi:tetratricopeptide (TPR) repeat protein
MTLPPDDTGQDEVNDLMGDDPMKWLESLAARQGANPEEFVTSADMDVPEADPNAVVDEPGYVDYDPFGSSKKPAKSQPPAAPPPPPPAEPAMSAAPPPEPPAGDSDADPMAWLESLAKRQGANPEEFVTEANLEIEEVDPNTVVDEPGYTPYDTGGPSKKAAKPEPTPPPPAPEPEFLAPEGDLSAAEAAALLGMDTGELTPVAAEEIQMDVTPVAPETAADALSDPMGGDVDPLAWLESLAKRQGAKSEELITSADMDVPEADPNAVIDEPGYVDYSPFGQVDEEVPEEPEAAPEPELDLFAAAPPEPEIIPSGNDTLAWLEGLAEAQGAGEQPVAADEPVAAGDPLAGLTDAEIEARSAAGELTPDQMEAWLARQAEQLAQARVDAEPAPSLDDEPAEPADIPGWLQEAMPESPADAEPAPLVEDITQPPEPADLPDWLADAAPAAPAQAPAEEAPDYDDSWAMALDEEYQTMQSGSGEEEPEWYRTALEDPARQAEIDRALAEEAAGGTAEAPPEEDVAMPEPADLPSWLVDASPEPAAEVDADTPDWLTEEVPEVEEVADEIDWLEEAAPAAEVEDMPDWLTEDIQPADVPDWLAEAAPDAPPEPEPEPAAPAPEVAAPVIPEPAPVAPPPVAPVPAPAVTLAPLSAEVPAGAAYDAFRAQLDANPQDHAARLSLARQLKQENNLLDALGQYEVVVSADHDLGSVAADLRGVLEAAPNLPQAHRILGDVLMRQGQLQDALKLYRYALEQL